MKLVITFLVFAYLSPVSSFANTGNAANNSHTVNTHETAVKENTDANIVGDVRHNGEHVPFINIFIKGTTIGTITDHAGQYQLVNLPVGEHILVAKGIGFVTEEVKVVTKRSETIEKKFHLKEDVLNLDNVVVTADRYETSRKESPSIVSLVTPKLLESTQAVNIAKGLNFVPGLRMEYNCQNCGFSQVRMNGMDGPYSQILINSRPVFSALAGVYGLELFPANMVDRIEVVRGGGSALFGGNAIAGTVNIITREPQYNSFNMEGRYSITGVGNEHNSTPAPDRIFNINGSIVTDDLNSGLSMFGMVRDRDPFDVNGDGFSEMVSMENTTLGLRGYHKLSDRSKLSLDLYRINEFRRGGNRFDYLPHEADITEQVDHTITGANLSFDRFTGRRNLNKFMLYVSGQTVERESYYGAEQDPNGYGNTFDISSSAGGQYHMSLGSRSTLLFGMDNNYNHLRDIKLGADGAPNAEIADQFSNTFGPFGQYEWRSERVKATLGLRYDTYFIRDLHREAFEDAYESIRGDVLAPRVNLLFNISPVLQFRTAYSKGYRAPQIFDEDLHIESSGARQTIHVNDAALTQESSHSFTSSFRLIRNFGPVMTEILAEGFYTRLLDPFVYSYEFVDSTKTFIKTRSNAGDGAFVSGMNFEVNAAFPNDISLQMGMTIQTSQYDNPQPWGESGMEGIRNFLRTPDSYGYFLVDWQPLKRLSASLTVNYTGRMFVPHLGLSPVTASERQSIEEGHIAEIEEERQQEVLAMLSGDVIEGERLEHSERFLVFGFRIAYGLPVLTETNLQIYAGVDNLFNQTQETQATHDKGIFRDAAYIYGPWPRMLNFGVKFSNVW